MTEDNWVRVRMRVRVRAAPPPHGQRTAKPTQGACVQTVYRLRHEGSLLHVVASVLRPESCTADDCGREGAPAVAMVELALASALFGI